MTCHSTYQHFDLNVHNWLQNNVVRYRISRKQSYKSDKSLVKCSCKLCNEIQFNSNLEKLQSGSLEYLWIIYEKSQLPNENFLKQTMSTIRQLISHATCWENLTWRWLLTQCCKLKFFSLIDLNCCWLQGWDMLIRFPQMSCCFSTTTSAEVNNKTNNFLNEITQLNIIFWLYFNLLLACLLLCL